MKIVEADKTEYLIIANVGRLTTDPKKSEKSYTPWNEYKESLT